MKKVIALMIVCAMAVCLGSATSQAADAQKKPEIRTSVQPVMHGFPLWYAENYANLKDAPFTSRLLFFTSGPPQIEALAAGEWDLGCIGAIPTLLASMRYGYKMVAVITGESDVLDIWVRPNSPLLKTKGVNPKHPNIYGTAADWKGKKIFSTTMSTGHMALSATLKALDLKDSDVSIVHMEQGQALTAFSSGEGDMINLWAPYSYYAEERGWVRVSSGTDAGAMIIGCAGVSKEFADKNPELVVAWLEQFMQSVEKVKSSPAELVDPLLAYFNGYCGLQLTRQHVEKEFKTHPHYNLQEQLKALKDPNEAKAWMRGVAQFLLDQNRISQKEFDSYVAADCYIDSSFMEKLAAKRAAAGK